MKEIIILVLEVILLILKMRFSPEEATKATAEKYGVPFSTLWEAVPRRWKKY